ncbi:hypothetical protein IWX50DRAFT_710597 [Phyllosticta citricarpa]|uniref:NFX1-type zinc finger-containing protein 1 n=1 Tax=Phyllosticta citricarpa TaxID=55181 RepID=A0ABR1L5U4_9PEZI
MAANGNICRHFSKPGSCRFGDRCKFLHQDGASASLALNAFTLPCRFLNTPGGCYRGASCTFSHDRNTLQRTAHNHRAETTPQSQGQDGFSTNLPPNAFTRLCKYLDSPNGCPYGASCTFSHDKNTALPAAQTQCEVPASQSQNDFYHWRFQIPKDGDRVDPLGPELSTFFQTSAKLVDSTSEIRQQVILLLASDGGTARVKELVEDAVLPPKILQRQRRFTARFLPFFKTISHPDVLNSLILEQKVAQLYGTLYGNNGANAIRLFTFVVDLFDECYEDRSDTDNLSDVVDQLGATTRVLSKVVDSIGGAQINPGIAAVVVKLAHFLQELVAFHGEPAFHSSVARMDRMRRRLKLADEIPAFETTTKPKAHKPTFHLQQDLPGQLSTHGPRHENDHQDIQRINILPVWGEILSVRSEYLPVKDPSAWHRRGIEGLIDRQFRLVREDTVGQLRDAIQADRNQSQMLGIGSSTLKSRKDQSLRTITYRESAVVSFSIDRYHGFKCTIRFPQPSRIREKFAKDRAEWWRNSKRLQPDAFICLYNDHGLLQFCSVCATQNKPSKKEKQLDPESYGAQTLSSDAESAFITVRPLDRSEESISALLAHYGTNSPVTLVEFPGVLFPAFEPTLKALQNMSMTDDVPFSEFLAPDSKSASGVVSVPPPSYAQKTGFRYNLKSITNTKEDLFLKVDGTFDHETLHQQSSLDEAQAKAVVDSLTRRLALIQGPPGTGKSYTGVALIKVLLENREAANLGPIVCVCYTNHALDQLLDHLIDAGIEQIIRIGSQSKSERLKSVNLREVAQNVERTKAEKRRGYELGTSLQQCEDEASALFEVLHKSGSVASIMEYLRVFHPQHHAELFETVDEEGFQRVQRRPDKILAEWLHGGAFKQLEFQDRHGAELIQSRLFSMTTQERKRLLALWIREIKENTLGRLIATLQHFNDLQTQFRQSRMESDLRCLQQSHVIGITTTGLARNLELLRRVRTKVMVCEEAGQVLESHLLTALLPSVEHAILIGDHLQLRPQINRYELEQQSRHGEQYSLDVSLLERLVKPDLESAIKLPFVTLETQRRMHPSISQLVRETLYPNLKDDPSTARHPTVPGVRRRLFWFNHDMPEAGDSEAESGNTTSKSNDFEVDMVSALVSHLIRQGVYGSQSIAVVTPYLGQLFKLRKRLGQTFELVVNERDQVNLEVEGLVAEEQQVAKASALSALKIATIDNFQGEEAEVVVISLVRCNKQNKCGFLKTSNRINVLLSRAKHGMYIIGNADTSRAVPMWNQVLEIMEENNNIGSELELQCERHPGTAIAVSQPDDFARFSPEGGCNRKCDKRLECGHACLCRCHSDLLHNAQVCQEPCQKTLKGCDHSCPEICGKSCPSKCLVNIRDYSRRLPCGHLQPNLPCWQSQDLSRVKCDEMVKRKIPGCEHEMNLACHIDVASENFQCVASCGSALPCGHTCKRSCKLCRRRSGETTHVDHGVCIQRCGRDYNTCQHSCKTACHGDQPCPLCDEPCNVSCSHSKCDKKCHEPCAPCAEADCSTHCEHSRCTKPCAAPCDWLPCFKRCPKILECGHQCPSVCGETCPDPRHCHVCATDEIKDQEVDYILMASYGEIDPNEDPCIFPSCGHILTVESMDGIMGMSEHYDFAEDKSIIGIKSTSADAMSSDKIKGCPKCRGSLRDVCRYGRIVRRGLLDESTKKFIAWSGKEYTNLSGELDTVQQQLVDTFDGLKVHPNQQEEKPILNVTGTPLMQKRQVMRTARELGLTERYSAIFTLRETIRRHHRKVHQEEQPFKKVFNLCEDARRRRQLISTFEVPRDMVQTGAHVRATGLLLRCDLAVLSDIMTVYREKIPVIHRTEIVVDLRDSRKVCLELLTEARTSSLPRQWVEAHVFFAQYAAMEASVVGDDERAGRLREEANAHIAAAQDVCREHPGTTRGMDEEIEATKRMLRESNFYSVVTNDEMRAVVAAMGREFSGTGHWYYCRNGHPFTIGECGGPMQQSTCPECGEPVGGRHHEAADGVTRAADLDSQFGRLNMG